MRRVQIDLLTYLLTSGVVNDIMLSHNSRVHTVLEKSLEVLEFCFKNSRPLKVLEKGVGP